MRLVQKKTSPKKRQTGGVPLLDRHQRTDAEPADDGDQEGERQTAEDQHPVGSELSQVIAGAYSGFPRASQGADAFSLATTSS